MKLYHGSIDIVATPEIDQYLFHTEVSLQALIFKQAKEVTI